MTAPGRMRELEGASIQEINALPLPVREALYARLVPDELVERLGIDRRTLKNPAGDRLVRIAAPRSKAWVGIDVRADPADRDPTLVLNVEMSPFGVPELAFVQITDPAAPRYGVDRDTDGRDTLFGTVGRNRPEEARALADGRAPGQVRRGLRLLPGVLRSMEGFCRLLGREVYLVEPLFYHSAILYERYGCAYLLGQEQMEEIHRGFLAGGALLGRLDGSTPFRQRGFEHTVRGRSWAIHDGILGGPWGGVKMYKAVGQDAGVSTFPDGIY